jgi:hypothetical protein
MTLTGKIVPQALLVVMRRDAEGLAGLAPSSEVLVVGKVWNIVVVAGKLTTSATYVFSGRREQSVALV